MIYVDFNYDSQSYETLPTIFDFYLVKVLNDNEEDSYFVRASSIRVEKLSYDPKDFGIRQFWLLPKIKVDFSCELLFSSLGTNNYIVTENKPLSCADVTRIFGFNPNKQTADIFGLPLTINQYKLPQLIELLSSPYKDRVIQTLLRIKSICHVTCLTDNKKMLTACSDLEVQKKVAEVLLSLLSLNKINNALLDEASFIFILLNWLTRLQAQSQPINRAESLLTNEIKNKILALFRMLFQLNDKHKNTFRQAGGILTLMSALNDKDDTVQYQATLSIYHLVHNNSDNQNAIREQGCLSALLLLLKSTKKDLLHVTLATLICLISPHTDKTPISYNVENQNAIQLLSGIPLLLNLLYRENSVIKYALLVLGYLLFKNSDLHKIFEEQDHADLLVLLERSTDTQVKQLIECILDYMTAYNLLSNKQFCDVNNLNNLLNASDTQFLNVLSSVIRDDIKDQYDISFSANKTSRYNANKRVITSLSDDSNNDVQQNAPNKKIMKEQGHNNSVLVTAANNSFFSAPKEINLEKGTSSDERCTPSTNN